MPNATALPGKKTLNFLENSMAAQKRPIKFWCLIVGIQGDLRKICQICVQLNKQTNKQTKWMKCPVIGNQIQRGKNLKFALNRYIADMKEGEKERKKITSFLSIWVISSKSKYKKNESKTDQINEEKLDIYRSNTKGKGRKELERDTGKKRRNLKIWGISSKSK